MSHASRIYVIVDGTSEPQDFSLVADGGAIVGTGFTVHLEISRYEDGVVTPVASPPSVEWLSQAAGTVRVTGVETLAVGNYLVRFRLADAGGGIGFVPNGAPSLVWQVVAVANR